ncbi:MAG: FtsX-like permease family protein [Bacteroides sp.]|nr:FtsX-like permease family protein [Bacteroides sp.]
MKRALLSQIKNDWKENLWLVVELLIVTIIVGYLTLTILRNYRDYNIPMGADISGVYGAQLRYLDDDGNLLLFLDPQDLEPEVMQKLVSQQQALLDRVRELPMVEYAAYGNNALPYNYSYYGNILRLILKNDTVSTEVNTRTMTPDGVYVLRLQSPAGKSLDDLSKILENGDMLLGPSLDMEMHWGNSGYDYADIVGVDLLEPFDDRRIGGIVNAIRRSNYEPNYNNGVIIQPAQENTPSTLILNFLLVRVKPGMEIDFEKAMKSEPTLRATTGVVLSKLHPVNDDYIRTTWGHTVQQRTYIAGILLLLVIIFIGLLGTFWYRVYLRTPEIAVRKTFGATDADIFRRILGEAMLLLMTAFLLAIALYFIFFDQLKEGVLATVVFFDSWKWDMALTGLITAALMSLMILIGVGIPARRAMKIEPAIALKEE